MTEALIDSTEQPLLLYRPQPESAGGYVPNREAVKAKSAKTFRSEQRKQARLQKTLVFV